MIHGKSMNLTVITGLFLSFLAASTQNAPVNGTDKTAAASGTQTASAGSKPAIQTKEDSAMAPMKDVTCAVANLNQDPGSCVNINTACLDQINPTQLDKKCLDQIKLVMWEFISTKTAKSLTEIDDVEKLPQNEEFFGSIAKRNDWNKNRADAFLNKITSSATTRPFAFKAGQKNPMLMARLFTGSNASVTNVLCNELTPEAVPFVSGDFFKAINGVCLQNLRPEVRKAIRPGQLALIPPTVMRQLNSKLVGDFDESAWSGLTEKQAANFGATVILEKGKPATSQQDALATLACAHYERVVQRVLRKEVKAALAKQCAGGLKALVSAPVEKK